MLWFINLVQNPLMNLAETQETGLVICFVLTTLRERFSNVR